MTLAIHISAILLILAGGLPVASAEDDVLATTTILLASQQVRVEGAKTFQDFSVAFSFPTIGDSVSQLSIECSCISFKRQVVKMDGVSLLEFRYTWHPLTNPTIYRICYTTSKGHRGIVEVVVIPT